MVSNCFLSLVLLLSMVLAPPFHTSMQNDADSSKKAETATLIVRAEDKRTAKVVAGAKVMVRWGDFSDDSKSKQNPTLETGLATFAKVPREKVKIQIVAQDFETSTCLYTIKKAEETVAVQLEMKRQDAMKECVALPATPKDTPPEPDTSPPHN
jgi:hypothetical protein